MLVRILIVSAAISAVGLSACAPGRRNVNPVKIADRDESGKSEKSGQVKSDPVIFYQEEDTSGRRTAHYRVNTGNSDKPTDITILDNSDKAIVTDADGKKEEVQIEAKDEQGKKIRIIKAEKLTLTHTEEARPLTMTVEGGSNIDLGQAEVATVKVEENGKTTVITDIIAGPSSQDLASAVTCALCVSSADGLVKFRISKFPTEIDGKKAEYSVKGIQVSRNEEIAEINNLEVSVDEKQTYQKAKISLTLFDKPAAQPATGNELLTKLD